MSARGILDGIRIIDTGTVLAAPGATGLLSDFGAEVIRVEQPGRGDPLRGYPPIADGQSLINKVTNRNKRAITLDLHEPRGRELLRRLVATAQAIVVNYRLPTLRKWGLDYRELAAVKPDLIMLHLTGYGRTGPYADRAGFARAIEAYTGFTNMTGYPDRGPLPAGYAVADGLGGCYGALSLMLALLHQQRTGEGQLIDLSLAEAMMRVMDPVYIGYDQAGDEGMRAGSINPSIAPHDIYEMGDGVWVSLPVSTENMFVRLCEVLGIPEAARDPRFVDNMHRVAHRAELDALLKPRFQSMTAEAFLELANGIGLAAARINSVEDFVEDRHVHQRQSLRRVDDPGLGRAVLMQNVVPRMSKTPGEIRWVGRELGQDNDYVYREVLGMGDDELAALAADGII